VLLTIENTARQSLNGPGLVASRFVFTDESEVHLG